MEELVRLEVDACDVELLEERVDADGDRIGGGIEILEPGATRPKAGTGRRGGERIVDAEVTRTEEVRLKVDVATPEREELADIDPERWRGGAANCWGRT